MASYVVRLDEPYLFGLLDQWHNFGCALQLLAPGQIAPEPGTTYPRPTLFFRKDVVSEWTTEKAWHRLRWLYYVDNADGVTLRLFDEQHFAHYAASGYYIEPPGNDPDDHYERVVVRGYSMGRDSGTCEPGLRTCRLMHSRPVFLRGDNSANDPLDLLRPEVTSLGREAALKLRFGPHPTG